MRRPSVSAVLAAILMCSATVGRAQQPPARVNTGRRRGPRQEAGEPDIRPGQRAVPVQLGTERRAERGDAVHPERSAGDAVCDEQGLESHREGDRPARRPAGSRRRWHSGVRHQRRVRLVLFLACATRPDLGCGTGDQPSLHQRRHSRNGEVECRPDHRRPEADRKDDVRRAVESGVVLLRQHPARRCQPDVPATVRRVPDDTDGHGDTPIGDDGQLGSR